MRLLQRPRHEGQVAGMKICAVERKGFIGPRRKDEIERLLKNRAALLRRNAVMGIVPRNAASDAEFKTTITDDVGNRGFLGDLDRVVQRQQRHRRTETDLLRPLRRRGQCHQRVGQYRKGPNEVNLAEPDGVKAKRVAEIYLRQNILVTLMFGKSVGARQLVEEPKAHGLPLSPYPSFPGFPRCWHEFPSHSRADATKFDRNRPPWHPPRSWHFRPLTRRGRGAFVPC